MGSNCIRKTFVGVGAVLLAVAVVIGFHAQAALNGADVGVPSGSTPSLEGLWYSGLTL